LDVESIASDNLKATTFWKRPNTGATSAGKFTAFTGGLQNLENIDRITSSFFIPGNEQWYKTIYIRIRMMPLNSFPSK
jgi:hypothetical protein